MVTENFAETGKEEGAGGHVEHILGINGRDQDAAGGWTEQLADRHRTLH
jgi:hypothetical protein